MSLERALIDTGAIYAFVVRSDEHHGEARRFVKRWLAKQGVFVLADVVFAETMTLLKARTGSAVAIRVGRELRENPIYSWTALGPDGERDTWAIFQQYEDKEWSYVVSALLAVARRSGIERIFAFDSHFDQMNAFALRRLPGPRRQLRRR